jgi:hypothetical protein
MRILTIAGLSAIAAQPALAQEEAAPLARWCGGSHNVSVGVRTGVELWIREADGGLQAEGQWPNVGLYGHFLGEGGPAYPCEEERVCLHFSGLLTDLEAAGFPDGTALNMTITLDMAPDRSGARGVYWIEPYPLDPLPQYGILELGACETV